MDPDRTRIDGSPFGRLPSLTHQIRELIRDYPEGIGIIKEVLQNADDAGARILRIVADHRTHPARSLPRPAMSALQGPALLFYNNEPFTDADFEGIQEIYRSGKVRAADKTGQFGKGFNTVYNVTDWPGFVTGNRVAFFDPHCTTIPGATPERPGWCWTLADCWRRYPDLLHPFTAAGLPEGAGHFAGTIFRLPFRTADQAAHSEISTKPFTAANLAELVRELRQAREELLLFLKRVEAVELTEVTSAGKIRPVLAIETENSDEVRPARDRLVARLSGDTVQVVKRLAGGAPPWESYTHRFVTRRPSGAKDGSVTEERSGWRVVAGLAVDAGGAVAAAVEEFADRDMKVVPLAGAAVRIEVDGGRPSVRLAGRVYCGLPLPAESGFAVHLNGYFDLDSSRHALTAGSVTGNSKIRARWNELLVAHVLAPAYARLIQDAAGDIGEDDPEGYYGLWPLPVGAPPKPLDALPGHTFRALAGAPVVRANSDPRWVALGAVWILPPMWESLAAPVAAAGVILPDPALPPALVEALVAGGAKPQRFTPQVARTWLGKPARFVSPPNRAPMACLRKPEWVESLLRFCMSDGTVNVTGLPLAITTDGLLRPFGPGPNGEPLYLAGEEERRIFTSRQSWFLDPGFAGRCGVVAGKTVGVTRMVPNDVIARLPELLPESAEVRLASDPTGFPSASWLSGVFEYLRRVEAAGSRLEGKAMGRGRPRANRSGRPGDAACRDPRPVRRRLEPRHPGTVVRPVRGHRRPSRAGLDRGPPPVGGPLADARGRSRRPARDGRSAPLPAARRGRPRRRRPLPRRPPAGRRSLGAREGLRPATRDLPAPLGHLRQLQPGGLGLSRGGRHARHRELRTGRLRRGGRLALRRPRAVRGGH
jgi:sacsin